MSTMVLIRSRLSAGLLAEIGKADYIEGLGDAVRELAEENEDTANPEITEVIRLYDWLEAARAEYLVLRAEINSILEAASDETDSAP